MEMLHFYIEIKNYNFKFKKKVISASLISNMYNARDNIESISCHVGFH